MLQTPNQVISHLKGCHVQKRMVVGDLYVKPCPKWQVIQDYGWIKV